MNTPLLTLRRLTAALLLTTAPLAAQTSTSSDRTFTIMPGVTAQRVSDLNGWAVGPTLAMNRRFGKNLSLDIVPSALLSSSGFYDFTGLALDLGPAFVVRGPTYAVSFGIGGTAIIGSDSDGSGGGFVGGYVSTQGSYWFSPRAGLTTRGAVRYVSDSRFSPGVSVGLSLAL